MTEKDIAKWKDKYWNLYYTEIEGYEFLWREISRGEYRKLQRIYNEEIDIEDAICNLCILETNLAGTLDDVPAGIPTTLCRQILTESGFTEDTTKIEYYMSRYNEEMNRFDNQIAPIINEAFPHLKLEEIENFTTEKMFWYLSRAIYVLKEMRGMTISFDNIFEGQNQQINKNNEQVDYMGEGSNLADFSELQEMKAFMRGELF